MRWVNVDNNWYIAVDVTAIGGGEGQTKYKVSATERASPMETIAALDKEFQKRYNSQDFAGVATLYNPGADLTPPTCDALINNRTAITDFFKDSFDHGLKIVHQLTPTKVFVEESDLWHEIGLCASCVGDLPNPPFLIVIFVYEMRTRVVKLQVKVSYKTRMTLLFCRFCQPQPRVKSILRSLDQSDGLEVGGYFLIFVAFLF